MLLACLSLLLATACSNTERVALGVCGNRIVEANEDCDGAASCRSDCRFQCSAKAACPIGFGCDLSLGVCRSPTGGFTERSVASNSQTSPNVADFDGDGHDDVLLVGADRFQESASAVYFFDPGAATPFSLPLPSASSAATADVTGDGRADVVLGGSSLLAYQSLKGRGFSPISGSSSGVLDHSRLFSADLDCDGLREILVWQGKTLYSTNVGAELTPVLELGFAPDVATNFSAVGRWPLSKQHSCEMLAILEPAKPKEGAKVHVYGAHERDGALELGQLSTVQLPETTAALLSLQFLDDNADGYADLVVQKWLEEGVFPPDFSVYLAFGLGDGSFDSGAHLGAGGPGDGAAGVSDGPLLGVLVSGQFDADPDLDFFSSDANSTGSTSTHYSHALALDMTADGRTDVAASQDGAALGLDLFRSMASGLFSRLPVTSNQAVTLRDLGDFDGDGQPDLLVSEGLATDSEQTTISVLFSPVTASTARVQELGALSKIEDMAAGYLSDRVTGTDGFADIATLHRDKAGGLQFGLLEGGVDRLLRSQLLRRPQDQYSSLLYISPALGAFRTGQGRELAAVVASSIFDDDSSIEIFQLSKDGAVSVGSAKLPEAVGDVKPLVLDLDANGVEELYFATSAGDLLEVHFCGVDGAPLEVCSTTLVTQEPIFKISAADVDGDGSRDLSAQGDSSISLFLANAGRHALTISKGICPQLLAHAWVQTDRDPQRELVVDCTETFDPEARDGSTLYTFEVDLATDSVTLLTSQAGPLSSELAVGDFNGDGLEDLVSSGGEFAFFLGNGR